LGLDEDKREVVVNKGQLYTFNDDGFKNVKQYLNTEPVIKFEQIKPSSDSATASILKNSAKKSSKKLK
jgi:hypothetical protein